jgi:hypothetical protein
VVRGLVSRRRWASEVQRRPLKNQKGCGIPPVTRQDAVSENDTSAQRALDFMNTLLNQMEHAGIHTSIARADPDKSWATWLQIDTEKIRVRLPETNKIRTGRLESWG